MHDTVETKKSMSGSIRVGLYPVDPKTGKVDRENPKKVITQENLILYGGSDIVARLLGGDDEFKIQAMFCEYENMADPLDPIVPPAFDREGGLLYYSSLLPPRDYVRVPITISPSILSSDEALYAGNQVTFFALTNSNEGINGLPFNAASNSTVYGVALAATPSVEDPTQDVVFARAYFTPPDNKFLKEVGHEIGIDWSIRIN